MDSTFASPKGHSTPLPNSPQDKQFQTSASFVSICRIAARSRRDPHRLLEENVASGHAVWASRYCVLHRGIPCADGWERSLRLASRADCDRRKLTLRQSPALILSAGSIDLKIAFVLSA